MLTAFVIVTCFYLKGATSFSQVITTEGKEFWLGFMENHYTNEINLEVFISATVPTTGTIEMPYFGWVQDFFVESDTTIKIEVPLANGMPTGSGKTENRGVHIITEKKVSVYALNKRIYSADATVVLPVEALGKTYRVISYKGLDPSRYSQFMVVAIEDSTEIEITPTQLTSNGHAAGVPYTITLHQGQTYQLQSVFDLTGTLITSKSEISTDCKNFAVFSGNEWTNVGGCGGAQDHLYEQMLPVKTWGTNFILVPFESRRGDIFRIVTDTDSTTVTIDGKPYLIGPDGFYEGYMLNTTIITTDNPVSVVQFSRSQSCDQLEGDPFMVAVSPTEQLLKQATFNALDIHVIDRYYVNIVTKTSNLSTVTLDGTDISNQFSVLFTNNQYATASLLVEKGNHTLASEEGFIAYIYGFGRIESFGYSAGASLDNLNFEVLSFDKITGAPSSVLSVCENDVVPLTVNADERFVHFTWDFGDGSFGEGDSLAHQFSQPGEYIVKVVASTATGSCGYSEEAAARIIVPEPEEPVAGPASVCPDTPGVVYFADSKDPANTYQWFVEGGNLTDDRMDSITVDWGPTNDRAVIKLITTNYLGCTGDTVAYPVKINVRLEPLAPIGMDSLCASDSADNLYYAYPNPTSVYNWTVAGGSISSGQGTDQVIVNWDSHGIGVLSYEESSTLLDVCSGPSDTTVVFIEREPDEALQVTSPQVLGLGDTLFATFTGDTLFNFMSWDLGNGTVIDSIPVTENVFVRYNCPGTYDLNISAYTGTLCPNLGTGQGMVEITRPQIEMVSVSNSGEGTLALDWKFYGSENYDKTVVLRRMRVDKTNWADIASFYSNSIHFEDNDVLADEAVYKYYLTTNLDCPEPTTSEIHQNILLSGAALTDPEQATELQWNEYIGWYGGVYSYEVWTKVDDGGYDLLTEESSTELLKQYQEEGFRLCYKILANENGGNNAVSWSNELCLDFVPQVITYNVLTPNGDDKNDRFYIKNIHHYPNARLTIVNRHGNMVFRAENYDNNWRPDNINAGVYFYLLELNEPRNPVREIKGIVTVFK